VPTREKRCAPGDSISQVALIWSSATVHSAPSIVAFRDTTSPEVVIANVAAPVFSGASVKVVATSGGSPSTSNVTLAGDDSVPVPLMATAVNV